MKNILNIELHRGMGSKNFLVSLLIGTAIIIWYSLEIIPNLIVKNSQMLSENLPMDFFEISYENWIGMRAFSIQQYIFYLILPILAALPYAASLFVDMNHGYLKNICIRESKRKYLIAKYISVFITGGAAVVIPLVLSILIAGFFLPTMMPESSYIFTNIVSALLWSDIFFSNPLLYVFIFLLMTFVFSGLLACTALCVSFFVDKIFIPFLFPFFVYIITSLFCELLSLQQYSIMSFLKPQITEGSTFAVILTAIILLIVSFFPYYFIGVKKDVY